MKSRIPYIIFLIPIINALADNTTNYFEEATINPGSIRAFLLFIVIIYLMVIDKIQNKTNKTIYYYLIFLIFLIPFSSNRVVSMIYYIRLFIPMMMYYIGYYYFYNRIDIVKINKYFFIGMVLTIFNLIISQLWGLGESAYIEDSFYTGGADTEITANIVFYSLLTPFHLYFIKKRKHKIYYSIIIAIGLVLVIVNLRRGPIIGGIAGLLILLFFLKKYRGKVLTGFILLSFIGLVFLNIYYWDTFIERYEYRFSSEKEVTNEGRYLETFIVLDKLEKGNLLEKLFGSEIFNSYRITGRSLHVDYNVLLYGTGIIGLIFYLLIYWNVYKKFSKESKDRTQKLIKGLVIALIVATLVTGFSKTLFVIGSQTIIFFHLGIFSRIKANPKIIKTF